MTSTTTREPIVVGVDGSPSSIAALHRATELATKVATSLRAVICWETPQFYAADIKLDDEVFEQDAREKLNEAITRAFGNEPPVPVEAVVRQGRPGWGLVEESKEAYLLVMGSRGHGEFVSMLLGSVSLECIVHALAPVVTVRADLASS